LLLIKPDGVVRGLVDEIMARVAGADLKVIASKTIQLTNGLAGDLYSVHLDKPFYPGLLKFITSGQVVANIIESEDAIARTRAIMGATDPREAEAGTIRGDLKEENIFTPEKTMKNLVHGSDSAQSARREIKILFGG